VNSVHSQAGYRRDGVLTAVNGDPADDLALKAHRPAIACGTQVLEQCQPVMTVSGYALHLARPAGPATRQNAAQVNAIQFRATMDTLQ
jgi:hypothetical protein